MMYIRRLYINVSTYNSTWCRICASKVSRAPLIFFSLIGQNTSTTESNWFRVMIFQFLFIESIPLNWWVIFLKCRTPTCYLSNSSGSYVTSGQFSPLIGIWVNQPIHSFLVGCLDPCLEGTSVRVGSPQPTHWLAPTHSLAWHSVSPCVRKD
jgi:hypothetical protein